jgi:hypothetical protein
MVCGAVSPSEATFSILLSLDVLSFILGAVWPGLKTISVLLIFLPVTLVLGSVQMAVDSEAMSLIVEPLAIIDISVSMDKSSLAVRFVIFPPSFIHGSIGPDLPSLALAGFFSDDPLAFISGVIFKFNHGPVLNGVISMVGLLVVVELAKFLSDLLNFLIIVILLDFAILVICITTHSHARIDLHGSNPLSCKETSNVCLNLDKESQLSGTHPL